VTLKTIFCDKLEALEPEKSYLRGSWVCGRGDNSARDDAAVRCINFGYSVDGAAGSRFDSQEQLLRLPFQQHAMALVYACSSLLGVDWMGRAARAAGTELLGMGWLLSGHQASQAAVDRSLDAPGGHAAAFVPVDASRERIKRNGSSRSRGLDSAGAGSSLKGFEASKQFGFLAVVIGVISVLLLTSRPATAQVDAWEFEVYPYATEERGVVELEMLNGVVPNGHNQAGSGLSSGTFASQGSWFNSYELTYGLTDRIEAAVYLDLTQVRGHGLWYSGSKYRLRGRLFDQGVLPIDLGWYVELEWHKTPQFDDDELELELRPIMEKDIGPFSLMVDPIFEKPLVGPDKNRGFEFGYVSGLYYRWMRYLSPGVEFYGGIGLIDDNDPLSEQQHYIFPVVWGQLPYGVEYNVGPGFGLSKGSDHVLVKFNFELERFIGSIFGPSSDSGWFF
jgi:hypothetical protein